MDVFYLTQTPAPTGPYGYYSPTTTITYSPTETLHYRSQPTTTGQPEYEGKPSSYIRLHLCRLASFSSLASLLPDCVIFSMNGVVTTLALRLSGLIPFLSQGQNCMPIALYSLARTMQKKAFSSRLLCWVPSASSGETTAEMGLLSLSHERVQLQKRNIGGCLQCQDHHSQLLLVAAFNDTETLPSRPYGNISLVSASSASHRSAVPTSVHWDFPLVMKTSVGHFWLPLSPLRIHKPVSSLHEGFYGPSKPL